MVLPISTRSFESQIISFLSSPTVAKSRWLEDTSAARPYTGPVWKNSRSDPK